MGGAAAKQARPVPSSAPPDRSARPVGAGGPRPSTASTGAARTAAPMAAGASAGASAGGGGRRPRPIGNLARLGALALALVVVIVGALVWQGGHSGGGVAASACPTKTQVKVAVPDELYGVVVQQARAAEAAGVCASYLVVDEPAGQVAKDSASGGNAIPDVWIPDSPIWVDDVSSRLGAGWVTQGGTIATSPVVFAVPKSLQGNPAFDKKTDWRTIFESGLPISVSDPTTSSTTISAAATAEQLTTDTLQRTGFFKSLVTLSRSAESQRTLQGKATKGASVARMYPSTEQQVLAFNRAHPTQRLLTFTPKQGAPQLSYQWVVPVKANAPDSKVLSALYQRLTSPAVKGQLVAAGFRVAGSAPPSPSALPSYAKLIPQPSRAESVLAVKDYNDLAKDARMLVMLDVSGSMSTPIDQGESRIQLLEQFSIGAVNTLPPTTKIGVWAFSTNLVGTQPWLDESGGIQSIAHTPTGTAYKARLVAAVKTLPGLVVRNGDTALYDSTWAAYQRVSAGYDARYVNSVVILTDGANDNPAGGLRLQQLLTRLRNAYNPDKPVKIVAIGIGNQIDKSALDAIASATNGLSYQALTASDVTNVFLDAFLKRS
ncbi:substrate-binding domain-containing protein [Allobranchiibius sp. CTAmp26]|uniref:substrate-binding domain-containing protein n=1 Tax=Allobranchiibius sp. CTAmp26 TaxID=2815214 RepID=UPI001AA15384|nr:VWA domain-containing protein [Allobranchiibius sp. CTAmp26]MBO1753540.1 substrate-binding domain-containing protein [Allobranchiibius sp. CTAmp26]